MPAKTAIASLAYTGLPSYGLLIAAWILLVGGVARMMTGRRRTKQ